MGRNAKSRNQLKAATNALNRDPRDPKEGKHALVDVSSLNSPKVDELKTLHDSLLTATTVKMQLQSLQKHKKIIQATKEMELTEETVDYCSRLYLLPQAQPVRKIVQAMIQSCTHEAELRLEVLQKEVLDRLQRTSDSQGKEQLIEQVQFLQTLSELPWFTKKLLQANASGMLTSFVNILSECASPILKQMQKGSKDVSNTLAAAERSGLVLKSIIAICSPAVSLLTVSTAQASTQLISCCLNLLRNPVVGKDLYTQAAIGLCMFYQRQTELENISRVDGAIRLASLITPGFKYLKGNAGALLKVGSVEKLGKLAQMSIVRGILTTLGDADLLAPVEFEDLEKKTCTLPLFRFFFHHCIHPNCVETDLNVRLYALQVLQSWLKELLCLSKTIDLHFQHEDALWTLLLDRVLTEWDNPSKKINHIIAPTFDLIMKLYQVLYQEQKQDIWQPIVRRISMQSNNRGKYSALSLLLSKTGSMQMLEWIPDLVIQILGAVKQNEGAAVAANLFSQLLDILRKDMKVSESSESLTKWRNAWMPLVLEGLVVQESEQRAQVSMYIVPVILRQDPSAITLLIEKLIKNRGALTETKYSFDGSRLSLSDIYLWAILELLKASRKSTLKSKNGNVVEVETIANEMYYGLNHVSPLLQAAAFDTLCVHSKSTLMPPTVEIELMKHYLVSSMKAPSDNSNVHQLGIKQFLTRVLKSKQLHQNALAKLVSKGDKGTAIYQKSHQDAIGLAESFQEWLQTFVEKNLYPGATHRRLMNTLQCCRVVLELYQQHKSSWAPNIHLLLSALVCRWDSVRASAFTVIQLMLNSSENKLPQKDFLIILKRGIHLSNSSRQRESDSGGLILRLLYKQANTKSTSLRLKIDSAWDAFEESTPAPRSTIHWSAQYRVFKYFCRELSQRVQALKSCAEGSHDKVLLVQGALATLRYLVLDTNFLDVKQLLQTAADKYELWRQSLAQLLESVWIVLEYALSIVGEQICDDISTASATSENPSPAKQRKVDCRGHVILDNEDLDDQTMREQSMVAGSWVALRECGFILESLLKTIPLSCISTAPDSLFPYESVLRAGNSMLNALFVLKHKGAVAMISSAFEGFCHCLLSRQDQSEQLGQLPADWIDLLLKRLQHCEQQFVLRRSAGFAYCFLAILRAEAQTSGSVLLGIVLRELLAIAESNPSTSSEERSQIHALNVLKLLFQDASLASNLLVYIPRALTQAVVGFRSSSWAIRNSSMMLFSAVLQRAIGDKRIADAGFYTEGIAASSFFNRFPQLFSFLLDQLNEATDKVKRVDHSNPILYPLLVVLTRLRACDDLVYSESITIEAFAPAIESCASHPKNTIRTLAGQALACVVPKAKIGSYTAKLMVKLESGNLNSNGLHGSLIQIRHLLQSLENEKALLLPILESLIPSLSSFFSSLDKTRPCFPILQAAVDVFSWSWQQKPDRQLADYHYQVFEQALGVYEALVRKKIAPVYRAGENLFLKSIARGLLCYGATSNHPLDQVITKTITQLLQTPDTSFPAYVHFLSEFSTSAIKSSHHQTFAAQALFQDPNLLCHCHSPSLVSALNVINNEWKSGSPTFAWKWVNALLRLPTTNPELKQIRLELLGTWIGKNKETCTGEHGKEFLDAVLQCHDSSQPLSLRYAVASSLEASGILSCTKFLTSSDQLKLWWSILKLFQDDHSSVRERIGCVVASIMDKSLVVARENDRLMFHRAIAYVVDGFGQDLEFVELVRAEIHQVCDIWKSFEGSNDLQVFDCEVENYFLEPQYWIQSLLAGICQSKSCFTHLEVLFTRDITHLLTQLTETLSKYPADHIIRMGMEMKVFDGVYTILSWSAIGQTFKKQSLSIDSLPLKHPMLIFVWNHLQSPDQLSFDDLLHQLTFLL